MPIYEYECADCGERFEVRQPMGEDSSGVNCPKCQAQNLRRLFSSFSSPGSSSFDASDMSCPTCSTGMCGLPPM